MDKKNLLIDVEKDLFSPALYVCIFNNLMCNSSKVYAILPKQKMSCLDSQQEEKMNNNNNNNNNNNKKYHESMSINSILDDSKDLFVHYWAEWIEVKNNEELWKKFEEQGMSKEDFWRLLFMGKSTILHFSIILAYLELYIKYGCSFVYRGNKVLNMSIVSVNMEHPFEHILLDIRSNNNNQEKQKEEQEKSQKLILDKTYPHYVIRLTLEKHPVLKKKDRKKFLQNHTPSKQGLMPDDDDRYLIDLSFCQFGLIEKYPDWKDLICSPDTLIQTFPYLKIIEEKQNYFCNCFTLGAQELEDLMQEKSKKIESQQNDSSIHPLSEFLIKLFVHELISKIKISRNL